MVGVASGPGFLSLKVGNYGYRRELTSYRRELTSCRMSVTSFRRELTSYRTSVTSCRRELTSYRRSVTRYRESESDHASVIPELRSGASLAFMQLAVQVFVLLRPHLREGARADTVSSMVHEGFL